jgi:hypothetical protein
MPRPKSMISGKICVDKAKKAHNCQNNSAHRIQCGDKRLKVPNGRSWDHYCSSCAISFLNNDISKLGNLVGELED